MARESSKTNCQGKTDNGKLGSLGIAVKTPPKFAGSMLVNSDV